MDLDCTVGQNSCLGCHVCVSVCIIQRLLSKDQDMVRLEDGRKKQPYIEFTLLLFSCSVLLCHSLTFCDPWTAAHQASLSQNLLKLMSIESVMPSNHLILCHPLLCLPSIFLSIRVFSKDSALCIRWPKHWSFSFSISPSNECSGLISFRIDWLDLLEIQGTFKSLLQHYSSKTTSLQVSAFFMAQLSHPYMTTGKTIAMTRRTFLNMLSRFVTAFFPRS